MSRFFALVVGVPFFLIGAGGLIETGPDLFFGAVALGAAVFMVLGLRTGVFVGAGEVSLRGWWRTVRLVPGDELVVVPYSSLWNWGAESAIFSMLALRRGRKVVPLQFTVGPVVRVRRLASVVDECRRPARFHGQSDQQV
ncbi:hypothetical protein [Oerskovia enterophila]|uniref:Uncharacterized protein n=1 Tax=Oerskovia enterophila TaxID=43678 RepID=A0A163SY91_9CELL|nr:hypothetical protein [Oerskovia enterophila]KZM36883.1 hypothetical protein OJAG_04110 [Oerskovia enterophila]OCI29622.1 hypothetical protein OERS_37000 [Oerskovia enterophila]